MTDRSVVNSNCRQTSDHSLYELGFNALDSVKIGAKPLLAYDEGNRDGVDPQNRRPVAGQHVEERFD